MARLYPRPVHLGGDRDTAGDVRRLRLRAAHAAEARGDVETSPQPVAALAELDAARVEDGVVGAVDDALRPDVHPAARGHLPVVGDAELHRAVPLLLVVEDADHQAVGEHHARRGGGGFKEAERVSRFKDEGLVRRQDLKVFLYQKILHPVLADLPRLAVGDELVGIEGDVEVEVVVDHHLKGLALNAAAFVFADGFAAELSLRAETVAVDTSARAQLLEKFGGDLRVILLGDIAQGVFQREHRLLFV